MFYIWLHLLFRNIARKPIHLIQVDSEICPALVENSISAKCRTDYIGNFYSI